MGNQNIIFIESRAQTFVRSSGWQSIRAKGHNLLLWYIGALSPNSQLSGNLAKPGWNCYHDNFKDSNPNIEWKATLEQAEKIGMGTRQYVLKKV